MKVVFCTPTRERPHEAYLKAMEASIPVLDKAGIDHSTVFEVGCPYISHARATMTRKALDAAADVVVYLDDDLSWDAHALVKLIETEGDVVACTYRYKKDEEDYMGAMREGADDRPVVRKDGAIRGYRVPGGFLKVTRHAIRQIMRSHPELVYGNPEKPSVDLFQHGAHEGVWYGEDMAFSRRWTSLGGEIWIVPDLNIDHHGKDKVYPGNYHEYLLRQPGGSKSANPLPPQGLKAA